MTKCISLIWKKKNLNWKAFIQSATEIDSYCLILIFFFLFLFFFLCSCVCGVRYRESLSSCELLSFSGLPMLSPDYSNSISFQPQASFYHSYTLTHSHTYIWRWFLDNANFKQWLFMPFHFNCYQSTTSQSTIFLWGLVWLVMLSLRWNRQSWLKNLFDIVTVKQKPQNPFSSYLTEINVLTLVYCSSTNRRFFWRC